MGDIALSFEGLITLLAIAASAGGIMWRIRSLEKIVKGNGNKGLIDRVAENTEEIRVLNERCKIIHNLEDAQ